MRAEKKGRLCQQSWRAGAMAVVAVACVLGGPGWVRDAAALPAQALPAQARPAAACSGTGSLRPVSGPPALTQAHRTALVRNVQVQASDCADVVEFLFWRGRPGWSVAYTAQPLRASPSGQVVDVPGQAHLVVRLSPASGTDAATGASIYSGPARITPARPSAVAGLYRLGDAGRVTTWALGLPGRRPFSVQATVDRLIVSVAAPSPRPRRCLSSEAGLIAGYPPSWYVDVTPAWSCRYFGPRPFPIVPNSDALTWSVTISTTGLSPTAVTTETLRNGGERRRSAIVAGYRATVIDVTVPRNAPLFPAGYHYRLYVVAARPHTVVMQSVPLPSGLSGSAQRALDQIAASSRRR